MKTPLIFSPLLLLSSLTCSAAPEIITLPPKVEQQTASPHEENLAPLPSRIEAIVPATSLPQVEGDSQTPPPAQIVRKAEQTTEESTPLPTKGIKKAGGEQTKVTKPAHTRPKPPSSAPAKPAVASKPTAPNTAQQTPSEPEVYDALVKQFRKALDEGRKAEALPLMKQAWDAMVRLEDFGSMVALAYTAAELDDETTAIMAARKAAELTDDEEFYAHLATILLRFGNKHLDEAERVISKLDPKSAEYRRLALQLALAKGQQYFDQGRYAEAEQALLSQRDRLDAGGLELLAWIQYRLGKLEDAAQQFAAAYAKEPNKSRAQGLVFSLHRLKRHAELLAIAEQHPGGPLDALLPPPVQEAIRNGKSSFTVSADATLGVASPQTGTREGVMVHVEPIMREKKGTPGEGRFSQHGVSLIADWQGAQDQLRLRLDQQRADDHIDAHDGTSIYALWQRRADDGMVYTLGLGRSPSGGVVSPAWLGEIGLGRYSSDGGASLRLFRRGNEESLLAFSGKRDPNSGRAWGRVVETGFSLGGNYRLGPWDLSGSLTASSLTGENVADNRKYEFYGRALRPVEPVPGLSLGPEILLSHYQRNLSHFTFGHGGYFSPDRFVQLSILGLYETRHGSLELNLLAGLGYNWNRQASAPYNPLTGEHPDYYPASRGQGLAYKLQGEAHLPITSRWGIGATLGAQKSPYYTDWRAGLYAEGFYD
jgi:tetratricopeptide (TPR) repeat protein